MKKNIIIALAALMVLTASCKKNIVEKTNNENTNPIVQTENSSVAKLLKFKKQVEYYKANPNIKDGETMTVEEAVLNVANLFNATYSEPEEYYTNKIKQEFSITLPIDKNGEILVGDVIAAYESTISNVRSVYNACQFANKGYSGLSVKIGEITSDNVRFDFTGSFGKKVNEPANGYPFTNDWYYSEDEYGGMCSYPYLPGSGADRELQKAVSNAIISRLPVAPAGYRNIYLDEYTVEVSGNDPNFLGLFYRSGNDIDYCIPADNDDMDDYNSMNKLYLRECECAFDYGLNKASQDDPNPVWTRNYFWQATRIEIKGESSTEQQGVAFVPCIKHRSTIYYYRNYQVCIAELPHWQLDD